jgi:hypothetical protein
MHLYLEILVIHAGDIYVTIFLWPHDVRLQVFLGINVACLMQGRCINVQILLADFV